jgi:hypothetical protein
VVCVKWRPTTYSFLTLLKYAIKLVATYVKSMPAVPCTFDHASTDQYKSKNSYSSVPAAGLQLLFPRSAPEAQSPCPGCLNRPLALVRLSTSKHSGNSVATKASHTSPATRYAFQHAPYKCRQVDRERQLRLYRKRTRSIEPDRNDTSVCRLPIF